MGDTLVSGYLQRMKKAVVLLSGGMDSAVTLYIAKEEYDAHALIFDYGQRAGKEIACAKELAKKAGASCEVLEVSLPWGGSSLVDEGMKVPLAKEAQERGIPSTYVPARNIIFLSYAVSFAEAIGASAVFIGAHELDYSNYPDCRSEFFASYQKTIDLGTKTSSEGRKIEVVTPIINKTKKEIVEIGKELGVPFELTWSCYLEGQRPCMECESCAFREKAFTEAGLPDPLVKNAS